MSEKKKAHILQLAWAGGVFDARISFPKTGYVMRFDIPDQSVAERFHSTVGVGTLFQRGKDVVNARVWVYYTTSSDDTRELILTLAPFMSAGKLKKAGELVARIERNPLWQKKNPEKAASLVMAPVE